MIVSKVKEKECENSYKNLDKLINAKGQKCFHSKYSKRNRLDKGSFTIAEQTQKYNKGKIDFNLDTMGGNFDGSGFYFNYSTE